MVQFTLPTESQTTNDPNAAAALRRLRNGPYATEKLTFIPGRSHLYLHTKEGEVGLARAVARYLVERLIALESFTVSVRATSVHGVSDVDGAAGTAPSTSSPEKHATGAVAATVIPEDYAVDERGEHAHHTEEEEGEKETPTAPSSSSSYVSVVPNHFQLAVSLIKGTLRTAYPEVSSDLFVPEASRVGIRDPIAYAHNTIAELVLTEVAPFIGESLFAGAVCAFFAHGVSVWTPEALAVARTREADRLAKRTAAEKLLTDVAEEDTAEAIDIPDRSVDQACWSLHRTAVVLSVAANGELVRRRQAASDASAAAVSGEESGQLGRLCANLHHALALVRFMARVGVVPRATWESIESLSCVYTSEDVQYLFQMPLPLPPLHADMTANLKEQSAICTMVRTVALIMVEQVSLTEWKWVNMKTNAFLTLLSMFFSPEEIEALQQFMRWCADFDELARSVVRDKLSIPSLFKVEKVIEARVLVPAPVSAEEEATHFQTYPVDEVKRSLRTGQLCTYVDARALSWSAMKRGAEAGLGDEEEAGRLADNGEVTSCNRDNTNTLKATAASTGAAAQPVTIHPLCRQCVGLTNAGNTCFVNGIVQLLFHCRPFVRALVRTALDTVHHAAGGRHQGLPQHAATHVTTDLLQSEDACVEESSNSPLQTDKQGGSLEPTDVAKTELPPLSEEALAAEALECLDRMKAIIVRGHTRVVAAASDTPATANGTPSRSREESEVNEDSPAQADLRTFLALVIQIGEMNWRITTDRAATTSIDMHSFLNALPAHFRDGQQHDASEFCKMLLELLDRAEKAWCVADTASVNSHADAARLSPPSSSSPSSPSELVSASERQSLVEMWFGGCIQTHVRCHACDDVRQSQSDFWDISLVVPKTKQAVNTDPTKTAVAAAGLAPPQNWGSTVVGGVEPVPPAGSILKHATATASADAGVLKGEIHALPHTNLLAHTTYASADESDAVPTPRGQRSDTDSFPQFSDHDLIGLDDDEPAARPGRGDTPTTANTNADVDETNTTEGPTRPVSAGAAAQVEAAGVGDGVDADIDPRTITVQHLLWKTTDPCLNRELLTGENQMRCTRCDARTDTELSSTVRARWSAGNPPCGATSSSACSPPLVMTSSCGVPHFLTLQLQRFAFDRKSLSFGKILQPVAMEEVILLPVDVRVDAARDEEGEGGEEGTVSAAQTESCGEGASLCYVPYRLIAILVHSGTTPYSGHYYTIVRQEQSSSAGHSAVTSVAPAATEEEEEETRVNGLAAHGLSSAAACLLDEEAEQVSVDADGCAAAADAPGVANADAAQTLTDAERTERELQTIRAYASRIATELQSQRVQLGQSTHANSAAALEETENTTPTPTRTHDGVAAPFLSTASEGMDVTGRASENWVMVNDSHVMAIESKRMVEVLQGKRGVYSALETPYVLLYERVPPDHAADGVMAEASTQPTTRVEFSEDIMALFAHRARACAAPPRAPFRDSLNDAPQWVESATSLKPQTVWNSTQGNHYYDQPRDGVDKSKPFSFFDTGTAGY